MKHQIYFLVCPVSKKVSYVGVSVDAERRYLQHLEVRQVLRGVRQLTPEAWAEARRQRAEGRSEQAATEASCSTLPPLS